MPLQPRRTVLVTLNEADTIKQGGSQVPDNILQHSGAGPHAKRHDVSTLLCALVV